MQPTFPSPRSELFLLLMAIVLPQESRESLPHDAERAAPASPRDEMPYHLGDLVQLSADARPLDALALPVVERPVDEERAPLDVALGYRPPEARVVGVVAVVPHAEVARRIDPERPQIVPPALRR